jgi:hypothetical protein
VHLHTHSQQYPGWRGFSHSDNATCASHHRTLSHSKAQNISYSSAGPRSAPRSGSLVFALLIKLGARRRRRKLRGFLPPLCPARSFHSEPAPVFSTRSLLLVLINSLQPHIIISAGADSLSLPAAEFRRCSYANKLALISSCASCRCQTLCLHWCAFFILLLSARI